MIRRFRRWWQARRRARLLRPPADCPLQDLRVSRSGPSLHRLLQDSDPAALLEKLSALAPTLFSGWDASDRVLIKINLNSHRPYPASTCPQMLQALIQGLRACGIRSIQVGDCSANTNLPTRQVWARSALAGCLPESVPFIPFEEGDWVRICSSGPYLGDVRMSAVPFQVDRVIALANIKTHGLADFSLGMKLQVGCLHPCDRRELHREHLQEKITELAGLVRPDVTIIDGRNLFISGGPDEGRVASGDRLWISTDVLAADLAAYRYLYQQKCAAGIPDHFQEDPRLMRQFRCFSSRQIAETEQVEWESA